MTINILNEVCTYISEISDLDLNIIEKNISKSLFVYPFNFQPEKLLFLYLHLENRYCIKFMKEDIINYKFSSIEKISEILKARI